MDLYGKVAWVTGGARMGMVVGDLLCQEGCRLAFSYRSSRKSAEEMAQALIARSGEAMILKCDLTQKAQLESAARTIVRHYGRLDIVVNLSSIYEKNAWEEHMKANAESAYQLTVAAAPWLQKSGAGRVVHIADWTSASACGPRISTSPMWLTSKMPAAVRTARCSSIVPAY